MSNSPKIKFNYIAPISIKINDVFIFPDGDFIIFQDYKSNLYDSKTLKIKMYFNIYSARCFNYFSNDEFGLMALSDLLELCKFKENRTCYETTQKIDLFSINLVKIIRIVNEDIIIFRSYLGKIITDIFRKRGSEYFEESKYQIGNVDNIIELDQNEFLAHKKTISPEGLELKIIKNKNYEVKKDNFIKADIYLDKKRFYFLTDIYKIKNCNKLICGGANEIFIIDINELELETTIKLDKTIKSILLRNNGDIFVLTYETLLAEHKTHKCDWEYHLKNIQINFQFNIIIKEEEKILNNIGNFSSFFEIYNYMENGLLTICDQNRVIIYDNFNFKSSDSGLKNFSIYSLFNYFTGN